FAIAWQSDTQDGAGFGIYLHRYNSAGVATSSELQVNQTTSANQSDPTIAMDDAGDLVGGWRSDAKAPEGIWARMYYTAGAATGEFLVSQYSSGHLLSRPRVAMDAVGNFVMVWDSSGQDGDSYGVYGRRYTLAGTPDTAEFRVNTTTVGSQRAAAIAM